MSLPVEEPAGTQACCGGNAWTWAAFVVALAAMCGSLWLTLGMDLIPCPLCYYQRTFAMSALAVLAAGMLSSARQTGTVSLMALPVALAGLGVAGWHANLEAKGALECPKGVLELGTAPQQSVAVFAVLCALLAIDLLARKKLVGLVGALALGAALAAGAVQSLKPPAIPPTGPVVGCRPVAQ